MNFDIIIPVTERNFQTLNLVMLYLRKNVPHRNIILIGNQRLQETFEGCRFIDEDKLYGALSYNVIRELVAGRDCYAGRRAGWYLQQFLKMSYSLICQEEYYLVWDADTIPVKKMQMFDAEGNPFFDVKEEYHRPYFTTLNRIFGFKIKKRDDFSFISEHMIIKTEYMRKLISDIEGNQVLECKYYYEKVINSIREIDLMQSGFSEFETYGNYVNTYYPNKYKIRRLKSLRNGDQYLHYPPKEDELSWAAVSYDIITMENRKKMYPDMEERINEYMKKYSLEEIVIEHQGKS